MFVTSMVRLSIIAASLAAAAGTAAAFSAPSCGTLAAPAGRRAAVSAPALRMGIGDMFEKAFANNPNIPTAPAVGPGSPGFSKQKPQEPKKTRAAAPPSPPPPAPAVWQQATDPASGNPYWYVKCLAILHTALHCRSLIRRCSCSSSIPSPPALCVDPMSRIVVAGTRPVHQLLSRQMMTSDGRE